MIVPSNDRITNKALCALNLIAFKLIASIPFWNGSEEITLVQKKMNGEVISYILPDELSWQREYVMVPGMLLCVYAGYLSFSVFKYNPNSLTNVYTCALMLIIFHIGWKNAPFWINGLQHVESGSGLYDPKIILELKSGAGLFWYFINLSFLMLSLLSPVFLIPGMFIKNKLLLPYTGIFANMLLNFLLFQLTPGYYDWFLD